MSCKSCHIFGCSTFDGNSSSVMGQSWVSMIMDRLHRVGKDNVKLREEVEHLRPLLSPQFIAASP